MLQNSKTQIATKLKNSNCEKTQIVTNLKTKILIKLQHLTLTKSKKKFTKLKILICDNTKKIKL